MSSHDLASTGSGGTATATSQVARWLLPVGAAACLIPGLPPWAALVGGAALALTLGNPRPDLTARGVKYFLPLAVTGLGAGVNLAVVARVGLQGLGYTLIGLLATFALGLWLARRVGVAPKLAALVCAGTSICGGSAIAAAAPAIDAEPEETTAALATFFGLDAHAFGLWCALAIHDTSSVTGAALTHGTEALVTATTVKLARTLWIVPVALTLGWWFHRRTGGTSARGVKVPWFIAGFLALSALFTFVGSLREVAPYVVAVAKVLLTLILFLIGAGLSRAALTKIGVRPFLLGLGLWLAVIVGSLGGILVGWIR